jgi:tRNA threonylcarbamoyladenosine biosynthesis protein TsaE
MKFVCPNENELSRPSEYLLRLIKNTSSRSATVVLLSGDLGSGKTTFTKFFAKYIGVTESVTSPTFIMQRKFDIRQAHIKNSSDQEFTILYHFDLYRVEDGDELGPIGFGDAIRDPQNIVFIEWPERAEKRLPLGGLKLNFSHIDPHTRLVEVLV